MILLIIIIIGIFLCIGLNEFLKSYRLCPNCNERVQMYFCGSDYRFPYDGRCKKCGTACPCTSDKLI